MHRRSFVKGMGLAAFSASLHAAPRWKPLSFKGIETRNTARNLIFVFLDGGPSHVDTFDLKTASYTPSSLGATTLANGLKWPSGIMPELAQLSDKFAILRSVTAIEAVHERATYHMLTSHRQNAAAMVDVPHFSSVLSYFLSLRENRPTACLRRSGLVPIPPRTDCSQRIIWGYNSVRMVRFGT